MEENTKHNASEKYVSVLEQKIQNVKREYRTRKGYTQEDYDSINFCAKCGHKVSRVYSFCPQCGIFHDEFNFRETKKLKQKKRF